VKKQSTQEHITRLSAFRQHVYSLFDNRRDSLFELMDAIVQTPQASSFAYLSLASSCTRQWHSPYKALAHASLAVDDLRFLCLQQLPKRQHLYFALDVLALRRMHSPTLQHRVFCHGAKREVNGKGVIIGLPYSILAFVDRRASSWALSLHTQRVKPEQKAVAVAIEQIKWLAANLPTTETASVALDGGYGSQEFFLRMRGVPVLAVARMRNDRKMYRRPPQVNAETRLPGRPRKYGEEFRFADQTSWGKADAVLEFTDEHHGKVRLQLWRHLRFAVKDEVVEIAVLRSQIHRQKKQPPKPHWYGIANAGNEDIDLQRVYASLVHRWPIEPANRFRKQRLHAELPKVRQASASDLWMTLLQLIEWELYLWREAASDERMPWQKPQATEQLSPARVIESLKANLGRVGSPVQKVLPRGKAPGWPTNRTRKRPPKYRLESKRRKRLLEMSKNE
jgi:hypothetical protein